MPAFACVHIGGFQSIFVCDNGNVLQPTDDTQGLLSRLCHERFPGTACRFLSHAEHLSQMIHRHAKSIMFTFLKETRLTVNRNLSGIVADQPECIVYRCMPLSPWVHMLDDVFLLAALYWVTEWWIPFLVAKNKIPNYKCVTCNHLYLA